MFTDEDDKHLNHLEHGGNKMRRELILATLYHVECHYSYMGENDSDPHTFGSLEGAKKFVEEQKSKDLTWYSIEGLEYRPCDDNNPGGKLYMGMIYFDYQEVR